MVATLNQDSGAALPSAAYGVGANTSGDIINVRGDVVQGRGLFLDVVADLTAVGVGGTAVITIDGKDPASRKYYNILTSAVLAANATTIMRIGPGLTAVGNLSANAALPAIYRIVATVAVNAVTLSVGFSVR